MIIGITQRDPASADFFDGTARGELLIRRCRSCAHDNAPQSASCARCGDDALAWTPAEGTGTIASWTVVHGRPTAGRGEGAAEGPTAASAPGAVVAIVELTEGPWLHARILDADPDAVATGQEVVVDFVRPEGGESVPVFRPRR